MPLTVDQGVRRAFLWNHRCALRSAHLSKEWGQGSPTEQPSVLGWKDNRGLDRRPETSGVSWVCPLWHLLEMQRPDELLSHEAEERPEMWLCPGLENTQQTNVAQALVRRLAGRNWRKYQRPGAQWALWLEKPELS